MFLLKLCRPERFFFFFQGDYIMHLQCIAVNMNTITVVLLFGGWCNLQITANVTEIA